VRTLRNLCAHRLDVAIDTASVRCMVDARGIGVRAEVTSYYTQGRSRNIAESSLVERLPAHSAVHELAEPDRTAYFLRDIFIFSIISRVPAAIDPLGSSRR
jgi:hypothetical protein